MYPASTSKKSDLIGLGSSSFRLAIYIANRPCNDHYPSLNLLQPLGSGELQHIVANNTNHWRKAFNVYAKLLFELEWPAFSKKIWGDIGSVKEECSGDCAMEYGAIENNSIDESAIEEKCQTWQQYRDNHFLQQHSAEALLFSAPDLSLPNVIHVVAGKTYASELDLPPLHWLDNHFAVNQASRLIVCPYLDYRQLSNERIERLAEMIHSLV